jgi:hypothetical protein
MKYFRLFTDVNEGIQRLGMPKTNAGDPVDFSLFFRPEPLPYAEVIVPIEVDGRRTDFTIAPVEIPVLSLECSALIQSTVRNPIRFVDGTLSNGEKVKLLHIVSTCDCLDYQRSSLSLYPKTYPRKELANRPQYITKLAIDRSKTAELDIFRVKDYEAALIISERVQKVLEDREYEGYSILYEV